MTAPPLRIIVLLLLAVGGLALPSVAQWPVTQLKNVQVLPEEITPRALVDTMRFFTQALGVRCSYCHVGKEGEPLSAYDFASDAKPEKEKTRVMLRMVAAINRDHLSTLSTRHQPTTVVQCATCHRGVPVPIPLPQLLTEVYARGGLDSMVRRYRELRTRYYGRAAYDFGEGALAEAATRLGMQGKGADAVRVHLLNVEMHPTSSLVRFQAGAAQLQAGDTTAAVATLTEALTLDSGNQGARDLLRRLGRAP